MSGGLLFLVDTKPANILHIQGHPNIEIRILFTLWNAWEIRLFGIRSEKLPKFWSS